MVEAMTKQLGERMSILLARKSLKGAVKRKRSNYERRLNKQLFKKSWDWSGGKIRRLELGKTIRSKPVETTDVNDIPIRVRTVDAGSYSKWLKSQKVVTDRIDHLVLKSRLKHTRKPSTDKKDGSRRLNFPAARSATNDSGRVLESEVQSMLRSMQKSSLVLPKILHLSDVLKLSEDTKNIIGLFLAYLDKDYEYEWKTNSSLQAFQISVCWVAVTFLKQEIDHKESLAIAKLQLDFACEEEEANHVYSELQDLEKGFICYLKNVEPGDLEVGEIMTRPDEAKISERTACHEQDLEEGEAQLSSNNSRKSKSPPSDQARRGLQRCFESRCLSDQLTGLEEGERPMSSNCAMNSKSNTLRGKYLEEEVMSRCSNRGKRSKSSISVEQECEGELPNRSRNQILSAQLMASEEGVAPVGTSDEIAKYSKMASCDWQDLEEGEILQDSIATNNPKNATPVLQDLEEGEIPIGSECHSISERLVNLEEGEIASSSHNAVTLEQELGSTTLDGSFKVKMDDFSCQIELHERNLKTSESAPNEVAVIDDTDDQQAPLDEVVFIGSDIMPTQNEPMTLQRASISDAAQDSWIVTPVDLESHSLECTVTHSSLVHQDMSAVQGESCPALQQPISTVPFTAKQRLPLEPLFFGGEGYQSGQMQSSSQETQIRRQLSLEDSTESCSPCTAHIPMQPVTSFHAGPNETFVRDAWSRINVQDFRSAANHLRFPNDHLFDSPARPEIPEHTSSDPLLVEMQRIANDGEKDDKAHEDKVLRLTSERDEEIRKVLQKYGPLIYDAEIARLQRKKEYTENLLKVYAHKFLAQVTTMNANGHMADLAQGKGKASVPSIVDQLIQLSDQQNAQMPVSGHEQYQPGPPMAPPAEVMSSRSSVCAPTIHARPCSSSMTCVARNLQNGTVQNEQMPALGRKQYQANLPMAPPAEVMSSHSSVCAPTIHARSSPSTFVPRNLQNGSEQNAKMPDFRREEYQANPPMAPPAELMSSHPSVCAPTVHTRPFSSPMMTCVPRNLQIGNELGALGPSPAPHLLQAVFRPHSSGLAPNHPVINNWTPSQQKYQPAPRQFAAINGARVT